MSRYQKIFETIVRSQSDANISFFLMCHFLEKLGFKQRIRGGHHIFTKEGVEEILNLQAKKAKVKPYQVKQIRGILIKYKLGGCLYA